MAITPAPNFSVDDASQAAKNNPITAANTEPGFANTYGPGASSPGGYLAAGIPALGVGGLGLLLLYRRHLQDLRDKEEEKLPVKQADLVSQLPGLHPKDMLLGAAVGGGAGLLYDIAKGQPQGRRLSTTLKRLLTGAGVGAVGANVMGDRARRYIANSVLPFGYDQQNVLSQLKPRSMQHVWDAAFADKPSFDPKALAQLSEQFAGNTNVRDVALAARYELNRRGMHVHTNNPVRDFWQRNKGVKGPDYYSVNEKNPNYSKNVETLYSATTPTTPPIADPDVINRLNEMLGWRVADALGANTLVGEQQVAVQPGVGGQGRVVDRYDVTPDKADERKLWKSLTHLDVLSRKWHRTPHDATSIYDKDKTNYAWLTSILGRMFWDRLLTEEHPWVSQRFQFKPDDATGLQKLELLRESGMPIRN